MVFGPRVRISPALVKNAAALYCLLWWSFLLLVFVERKRKLLLQNVLLSFIVNHLSLGFKAESRPGFPLAVFASLVT